jgi:hypothetical protein
MALVQTTVEIAVDTQNCHTPQGLQEEKGHYMHVYEGLRTCPVLTKFRYRRILLEI